MSEDEIYVGELIPDTLHNVVVGCKVDTVVVSTRPEVGRGVVVEATCGDVFSEVASVGTTPVVAKGVVCVDG